jgi:hypothetical protein
VGGHKKAADSESCALSFVGRPRSVWVANLAAIAQHQRILVEIRHSEVIQVTRGAFELPGPTGDVRSVVSPGYCNNCGVTRWIGGGQNGHLERDRVSGRSDPLMLKVVAPVAVLSQDGGCD